MCQQTAIIFSCHRDICLLFIPVQAHPGADRSGNHWATYGGLFTAQKSGRWNTAIALSHHRQLLADRIAQDSRTCWWTTQHRALSATPHPVLRDHKDTRIRPANAHLLRHTPPIEQIQDPGTPQLAKLVIHTPISTQRSRTAQRVGAALRWMQQMPVLHQQVGSAASRMG
jgi:hypothetical protein